VKSIEDIQLTGRRVLMRVDFNVPLKNGRVNDATRIRSSLTTVRYAIDRGAKVILASHLGRPDGKVKPELSLGPVAHELAAELGSPVALLPDCVGPAVEKHVGAMLDGDVALLENLRFHAEEESNDPAFAKALASLCDVYVNDAFGTAHRAHASTAGVVDFVSEAGAGFLLLAEVKALGGLLTNPARPFVAVLGGAKVSDKIALIRNLLERIDSLIVGGAMAYTFLSAQGIEIGASRVEKDKITLARDLLAEAAGRGVSVALPIDHVVAREFQENAAVHDTDSAAIEAGWMGVDIGPRTRAAYCELLAGSATVFWNGPMGVFEWKSCAGGTTAVANAVADSKATSVVGGGDSVAALAQSGRAADITHISTGGGASLELMEGKILPGVAALDAKAR